MMEKQTTTWLVCAALAAAMPLRADVRATLSQSSIAQNESVTLTLESDAGAPGPPDLSPLERDFRIVHRSTSRSMRSFNGRRSQQTAVTLTLIPKHGGELLIPAIDFGQERSQVLEISVIPTADVGLNPGFPEPRDPASMQPNPFPFPPPPGFSEGVSEAPPVSTTPDWGGMQSIPGWGGYPGMNGAGFGMPEWVAPADIKVPSAQSEETVLPTLPKETGAGYWPWITGLLLAGWIITMLLLGWRTRRPPIRHNAAEPSPVTAPTEDPKKEAADALDHVRRAYERNDTYAAKTALLRWATTQWPANPPTNLSRLAARCPTAVQRQILKLDESLYSPEPLPWNDEPVWEQLSELDRNGPDQPPPASGLAHSSF